MIANHIHHALQQVERLRSLVDRQQFNGYSGRARMSAATVALLATAYLAFGGVAPEPMAHLQVWGVVFVVALTLNYGAVLHWFLHDPEVDRQWRKLAPALDVVPPLFVAGVFTTALLMNGHYDYLFGIWMTLFGIANFSSRHVLPRATAQLGIFYIIAGTAYLLVPGANFTNPWPMGLTFGLGEIAGGLILHFDHTRKLGG